MGRLVHAWCYVAVWAWLRAAGMKLVCAEALSSSRAGVRGAASCLWDVNTGVGRLNFPVPQKQTK